MIKDGKDGGTFRLSFLISLGKYYAPLSDSSSEIYHTRFENWFAIDHDYSW
jgi:hypothetical protein